MVCPSCGFEQPEGTECTHCGIVFAKWEQHQARVREGETAPHLAPHAPLPLPPRVPWWARPLGRFSRGVRLLAGLASLCMALLLYLNGNALRAFGPYVALVFFVAAGLYLVVTFLEVQRWWRFAVEAGVMVAACGVTYLALPDVFSLEKEMYESSGHLPMPSVAGGFLDDARGHIAAVRRFLDATELATPEEAQTLVKDLDVTALAGAFQKLPRADQDLTRDLWLRLSNLRSVLGMLAGRVDREFPKGPAQWVPTAVAADVRQQLDTAQQNLDRIDGEIKARLEAIRQAATAAEAPAAL